MIDVITSYTNTQELRDMLKDTKQEELLFS